MLNVRITIASIALKKGTTVPYVQLAFTYLPQTHVLHALAPSLIVLLAPIVPNVSNAIKAITSTTPLPNHNASHAHKIVINVLIARIVQSVNFVKKHLILIQFKLAFTAS